jgi:superfamily II DNA or RNA helicase
MPTKIRSRLHVIVLHGRMTEKGRREVSAQLGSVPRDEERVVLATGRFAGEGFDDPRLDTLFLVLPVSWKGTLIQYSGRLHRQSPEKTEARIYDYVGYRAMGYRVHPGPQADSGQ